MAIQEIWFEKGCTACRLCAELCPDVFTVDDEVSLKEGVNYSDFEEEIMYAVENCPQEVIQHE